ncbi:MAG: isoprenylcysteine carboxylmethyltransferase family protein [Candidatus Palauibacterales bacterium]|nr:isoprenylcysteine carboxylmethyltransferase family protein [Candidatus Palauibacterales bacterium]MDP2584866.1 isoprenylcysteine carboxylmethyltransferase family protein [Candidatus Palauibacterales bacterium]
MKATAWEFRHRSLIIGTVYALGFSLSGVQPITAGRWVARLFTGTPVPAGADRVAFGVATLVVAGAAALRTWGTSYLGRSAVYDAKVRTESLVADGPYRFVRNPLYLGTILLGAGIGSAASPIGWLVLVTGLWVVHRRLVGREETYLLERHGDAYRRYRTAVPRLLPALGPRVPASGAGPDWRAGWRGEADMWCLAAGVGSAAVTLSMVPFEVCVGVGLLLLALESRRARRPEAGKGA